MTGDSFNAVVSSQDPGLIVVTTAEAGERAGCLVSFHSQSSIGPQRYCVWLSKANHTYRVALRSTHLAIHSGRGNGTIRPPSGPSGNGQAGASTETDGGARLVSLG